MISNQLVKKTYSFSVTDDEDTSCCVFEWQGSVHHQRIVFNLLKINIELSHNKNPKRVPTKSVAELSLLRTFLGLPDG